MDVRARAWRRSARRRLRRHRRHAERHAAVHPRRPTIRAAARTAASASAQQQRDPAGNPGAGGAGRLRCAAPTPDRHLRRPQRARRRRLLSDGAGRRIQRRRSLPPLHANDPGVRHGMGLSMADALAKLGAVDHVAVGLADFGKPDGFLERQVPRWLSELDSYGEYEDIRGRRSPGRARSRAGWNVTGRRPGRPASCTATTTPPT